MPVTRSGYPHKALTAAAQHAACLARSRPIQSTSIHPRNSHGRSLPGAGRARHAMRVVQYLLPSLPLDRKRAHAPPVLTGIRVHPRRLRPMTSTAPTRLPTTRTPSVINRICPSIPLHHHRSRLFRHPARNGNCSCCPRPASTTSHSFGVISLGYSHWSARSSCSAR